MLILNAKTSAPWWWKKKELSIKFSLERGRGVYTKRHFYHGEVILTEEAIENVQIKQDARIFSLYPVCRHQRLGAAKVDKVDKVSETTITQILDYNCFDGGLGSPGSPGSRLLFLHISLINHSCAPNADIIFFDAPNGRKGMRVFAIRDIEPGEEIFISYLDRIETLNYRARAAQLLSWLLCTCTRCVRNRELETARTFA